MGEGEGHRGHSTRRDAGTPPQLSPRAPQKEVGQRTEPEPRKKTGKPGCSSCPRTQRIRRLKEVMSLFCLTLLILKMQPQPLSWAAVQILPDHTCANIQNPWALSAASWCGTAPASGASVWVRPSLPSLGSLRLLSEAGQLPGDPDHPSCFPAF